MFKKASVADVVSGLHSLVEKLEKILQDKSDDIFNLNEELLVAQGERDRAGRIIGKLKEILK